MPRSLYLLAAVALVGALTAALTIGSAASNPGTAEAVASQYTVTRTWGPYNGALPIDATVPCGPGCAMTAPGAIPDFSEAPSVYCNSPRDAMLGGASVINHKTSHGTTTKDVVNLDRFGAFWDPEAGQAGQIGWGTWIRPTGRAGWNSVTITVTCLVRK